MDDEGNTFFDAPTTEEAAKSKRSSTTPTTTTIANTAVPYDDGGEPDFEGWLKAQASAKSGKPLPKGLAPRSGAGASASASAKAGQKGAGVGKPSVVRGTTTGSIDQGVGAKKLAGVGHKTVEKVIDTKPKVKEEEDDWGDAWD